MAQSRQHQDRPLLGLTYRLIAIFGGATLLMLVKYLGERDVHLVEILFYRYLIAAITVGGFVLTQTGLSALKTEKIGLHILRAMIGIMAMALNFWAVMLLPMAEAATLGFTMPLIATVLSVLILGEVVGIRRWSAVIIGFLGVIIAISPWSMSGSMSGDLSGQHAFPFFGTMVALAAAATAAMSVIMVRKLAKTESTHAIVLYYVGMATPILAISMFWFGSSHSLEIMGLVVLVGILGTLVMWMYSESVRLATIAVLAPIDYLNFIFSAVYGYIIWNHWPAPSLWLGLPLIIWAGIYIARREHKRRKQPDI